MSSIVGLFADRGGAGAACRLLEQAGYDQESVSVLAPPGGAPFSRPTPLLHRGESMLRTGLKWGVAGALLTEAPFIVLFFFLPVDGAIKVLMLVSAWKFGAAFGGWLGVMFGGERGLDQDAAEEYEQRLANGEWIVAAEVRRGHRSSARGAMVESGASEARDIRGTLEPRRPIALLPVKLKSRRPV